MNSSIVIGAFLLLGPVLLVACIAVGLFGFNPEKAQAIRNAEAQTPIVLEEIRRIHIRSPDKFRHDRLDRHPFYLAIHGAVWFYAWCIFGGAALTSNVQSLNAVTRMTMAGCFIVGSTMVLAGSAMGMRVGHWRILKGIHDNLTSSMLADDIRLPYTFASAGALAIGVSMGIYAQTSFHSTLGSIGGWMTGASAVASGAMIVMFYHRIRRYDRARTTLITEAVAQIELSDVDVTD